MDAREPERGRSGGGSRALARVRGLPLRYPLTLLWAVLMLLFKSGVLEGVPALLSAVSLVGAPLMIPAYVVGLAWLGVGQQLLGIGAGAPVWFEVLGVLIVGGAYVLLDGVLWRFRSTAARARLEPRRRP